MRDFSTPSELANWIHRLNTNNTLYDYYRQFKYTQTIANTSLLARTMSERTWGIHNDRQRGNFINRFECLVCERAHETRINRTIRYQARFDHYGCPPPTTFDTHGQLLEHAGHWYRTYEYTRCQLDVFEDLLRQGNLTFTEKDLYDAATRRFSPSFRRSEFL
jgi:hypothetical protein